MLGKCLEMWCEPHCWSPGSDLDRLLGFSTECTWSRKIHTVYGHSFVNFIFLGRLETNWGLVPISLHVLPPDYSIKTQNHTSISLRLLWLMHGKVKPWKTFNSTRYQVILLKIFLNEAKRNKDYKLIELVNRSKNNLLWLNGLAAPSIKCCTKQGNIHGLCPPHLCSFNSIINNRPMWKRSATA